MGTFALFFQSDSKLAQEVVQEEAHCTVSWVPHRLEVTSGRLKHDWGGKPLFLDHRRGGHKLRPQQP